MRHRCFGALGAGVLTIVTSIAAAGGCSTPGENTSNPSVRVTREAIQGGTDDGTAHPYAVGVCADRTANPNNPCSSFCSGALILPNVVVTARHCVDNTTKIIDCTTNPTFGARHSTLWITTSNQMFGNPSTGWHQVKSVVTPTDDHVCGHDIALLVLNDVVDNAEAKPAIPGVQYAMGDLNRYTHRFTAIGFGNTSPQGFSAGTRRIRQALSVACIPGDADISCPAGFNDSEFYGSDGPCEGDSGSSAFEQGTFLGGNPVSFGVLSRGGESADGLTCKGSLYTRLDKFRDLVLQAADAASNNWTLYPKPVPDWTVYVPPPPDAGVDSSVPKPTNRPSGYACADNSECKSNVCADTGAGKACTVACDEAADPTTCPEAFVCKAGVCVQDLGGDPAVAEPPPPAKTTTTTSGGCAMRPGTQPEGPLGLLLFAGATGWVLSSRRRGRRSFRACP
jgi:hypothetical protein